MKAETLKGHLDMLLLSVVADGPRHGYAVIEALRQQSGDAFDLPEGTVYPALHRLQRAGLLTSSWGEAGGRRRRVYSLTTDGKKALAHKRREWNLFAGAVQRVVKGTPWPSTA
jgi:PadR family transcriptional regulator, regulatory protein PadR